MKINGIIIGIVYQQEGELKYETTASGNFGCGFWNANGSY